MRTNIINKIKSAPKTSGVYIFYEKNKVLYIGKASNLKERLRSYLKTTDQKTVILDEQATRLQFTESSSPISALIKEAELIKKLKPQLNIYWKDDRQYFYVAFSNDKFPRIYITHQPSKNNYIGPFTDGRAIKLILQILRRHFPYCTCKETHRRECLNSQIELCPGYCCVKYEAQNIEYKVWNEYQKNIKTIKAILTGKKKRLLEKLIQPKDIWAAKNILEHSKYIPVPTKEKPNDKTNKKIISHIECYDISNLAGKEAIGAMTTLKRESSWTTNKNQWRTFKIKRAPTRDDARMIAEILERRLNHPEWPYPDLVVIDGGKTQYNATTVIAKNTIGTAKQSLPHLISFAKPRKQIIGLEKLPKKIQEEIKQLQKNLIIIKIINQTHGFAIRAHRRLREQNTKKTQDF